MKRIPILALLLMGLVSLGLNTTSQAQGWQLVWQDEFTNGISNDWVFETGSGGWGNNEMQYYRSQNASVQDGQLVITARKESYGDADYTSARMITKGRQSFKYGKIEARIALPSVLGLWPAFWMLGSNFDQVSWPYCGEIDIMEQVNTESSVHGTIHWSDANNNYASYGGYTNTNVTAYHVYSIEWDENAIKWFVDGSQYHEVNIANGVNGTQEFHNEFFLLLNMAVGGNWPQWEVNDAALPANMYVDYVRVYRKSDSNNFSLFTEAENYSSMSGVQTESTTDAGGGLNVGYIETGDWMAYNSINIPSSGYYQVEYRVASENGGSLSLDLNAGSTVLGNVSIPATGGWQNWTSVFQTVYINAGTYNFGIYAQNGGWNINWFRITGQSNASARADQSIAEQNIEIEAFQIYPNPAQDRLYLKNAGELANLKVYNSQGQVMLQEAVPHNEVDISALKPGLYTIQINSSDKLITKKFIKQ
ncbi:carbohydrate-binding protein [Fulvivirga maritima]|uniref:carbohydrate-binding protein n=1 Tax=Fulvivirga maritima TaxID=2904247 RepID=UPI001F272BBD|nr:carbohydrate-binding protein [Fulvivirga maritima]UII26412.1 carbohydrate-binding protein [Fulvivirga maritima]